jgi:hypothetical protein
MEAARPMDERRRSVAELHILNLGAGVQSTFLYMAFMRGLFGLPKLDAAIFADTGDEPGAEARELGLPDTPGSVYAHVDWLKSLGGPRIYGGQVGILSTDLRDGRMAHRNSPNNRCAAIPAFTTDGVSKGRTKRQCSKEYKIEVIGKVLRREILGLAPGRSPKGVTVHQYTGISFDEAGRAGRLRLQPCPKYIIRHFPLVEKFITRAHCSGWLAGQVPHEVPRSACVECPFHSDDEWLRIKNVPLDWQRAVRVDESLRTTGSVANRDMTQTMYLHRSMKPLVQIQFKPSTDERAKQSNINFAPECLGVCGV